MQASDRVLVTPNKNVLDDVAGASENKIVGADFLSSIVETNIVLFNKKGDTQTNINHTINSLILVESTDKQMSKANQASSLTTSRADSNNNLKPTFLMKSQATTNSL